MRTVRSLDVNASDTAKVANGIEDMYNDTLDELGREARDPESRCSDRGSAGAGP